MERRDFLSKLPAAGIAGVALLGASSAASQNTPQALDDYPFVSVRDFGAVGDGVADDTTSLQNAFNAAAMGSHGLLFPDGIYRITRTLAHTTGALCLSGIGSASQVTIRMDAAGDMLVGGTTVVDGIFFKHSGATGSCLVAQGDGSRISACTFQNGASNSSPLVQMHRSNQTVKDCYFENNCQTSFSIVVERSVLGLCINGSIKGNRFYGAGQGLCFTSSVSDGRPEGWSVTDNKFVTTGNEAILVNAGLHLSIASNVIDQARLHAVSLTPLSVGIDGVTILDNYIATPANTGGVGIQTQNGVGAIRHLKVSNNNFELCGYGMIVSNRVRFLSAVGNSFDNISESSIFLASADSASITANTFRGDNFHLAIAGTGGSCTVQSNVFDRLGSIYYELGDRDGFEFSGNTGIRLSGWCSGVISTASGGSDFYLSIPHGLPFAPNLSKVSASVVQMSGGHMNVSALIHGADQTNVVVQVFCQTVLRGSLKVNLFVSI
jgi:hypothetical protein